MVIHYRPFKQLKGICNHTGLNSDYTRIREETTCKQCLKVIEAQYPEIDRKTTRVHTQENI